MLTLKLSEHASPVLVDLMKQIAKQHVSATPVVAQTHALLDVYTSSPDYNMRVDFYDGRFIGTAATRRLLVLNYEPDKKRWKLNGDRIDIPGRGKTGKSRDYVYGRSVKAVIKHVLQYAYPMTPDELMNTSKSLAMARVFEWVRAVKTKLDATVGRVDVLSLMDEIQHMHELGVVPCTPKFARLALEGLPIFADYKYRAAASKSATFVMVAATNDDGFVLSWSTNDGVETPLEHGTRSVAYPNYDAFPSGVASKWSMLCFSEDASFVPEVGYRVSKTLVWLYLTDEELAQLTAAAQRAGEGV
jgi:hypothetical protein